MDKRENLEGLGGVPDATDDGYCQKHLSRLPTPNASGSEDDDYSNDSSSFMTDDDSSTLLSRLTQCEEDDETPSIVDDVSELTDIPYPGATSATMLSLNTEKLVRAASEIAAPAHQAALDSYRGILDTVESSSAGSPWVDSLGQSSSESSSFYSTTSVTTHSTSASLQKAIATKQLASRRFVAVGNSRDNDIENGTIGVASHNGEISTVAPMDKKVASAAFGGKRARNNKSLFGSRWAPHGGRRDPREPALRRHLEHGEVPAPVKPFASQEATATRSREWREKSFCELFFLFTIAVSLVCLVMLVAFLFAAKKM